MSEPLTQTAPERAPAQQVPLLQVKDLKKHFAVRGSKRGGAGGFIRAVDGVSFHIDRGETLSLVGESGCGKSTVGRAVLRLNDITAGEVILAGQRIDDLSAGTFRPMRRPSSTTWPAVMSNRRRMARPTVDLPQPLSPTSESVSPRWMVNDTPSTA